MTSLFLSRRMPSQALLYGLDSQLVVVPPFQSKFSFIPRLLHLRLCLPRCQRMPLAALA